MPTVENCAFYLVKKAQFSTALGIICAKQKRLPCKKVKTFNAKTPSRKVAKFCKLNLRKSPLTSEKVRFGNKNRFSLRLCNVATLR